MLSRHPMGETGIRIWTIGHSRTPLDRFLELLYAAGIRTLVDVRSIPFSRHAPHASRGRLAPALAAKGIRYEYFGDRLGGRPADPALLTAAGDPDYAKMAASPGFRSGITQLLDLAAESPTCIMCSEEAPERCHRTRLIAPALMEQGATLLHLRHDGRIEAHNFLL